MDRANSVRMGWSRMRKLQSKGRWCSAAAPASPPLSRARAVPISWKWFDRIAEAAPTAAALCCGKLFARRGRCRQLRCLGAKSMKRLPGRRAPQQLQGACAGGERGWSRRWF
eukprot:15198003-Alexandrium_andersonii.AAC.1